MGDELFRKIENRLLRGKALMDNVASRKKIGAQQQMSLELFVQRRYSMPEKPDVEIERRVWAFRGREKRLAVV